MNKLILIAIVTFSFSVQAQESFPINGVSDDRPSRYAFTNATIFVDHATSYGNATLLIEDGKVVAAGKDVSIPPGTQKINLEGKFIYPAFVDPYTFYGQPEVESGGGGWGSPPQYESKVQGPFGWNEAVKSEYESAENFTYKPDAASTLRKNGFGAVLSFRPDGVVRGTGALVLTSEEPEQNAVLNSRASFHFSFDKGSSKQNYPSSIMGMVALIRQTYYDAQWYQKNGAQEQTNLSLDAFNRASSLPKIFEANGGKLRVLLADKIADEFSDNYIIKGSGDEYQRLKEIKSTGAYLIIPVNFPDAYEVDDPIAALDMSLSDLKHWELAPKNPALLSSQGIEFAFTASGLKDHGDYLKNIRKSVKYGLQESQALKAMTSIPAKLIRAEDKVGSLKSGMLANFIITSSSIFDDKSKIYQTWVKGKRYEISPMDEFEMTGSFNLTVDGEQFNFKIEEGTKAKIITDDSTSLDVKLKVDETAVTMSFVPQDSGKVVRLSGWIAGSEMKGSGRDEEGNWIEWTLTDRQPLEEKEEKSEDQDGEDNQVGEIIYPFVAHGWKQRPEAEKILFKNATVWTMEDQGRLEEADLLIENGKIIQVGMNISAADAREIDASGLHITPGIIDEHSHIALSGVNEGSHAVTSEVRMYDAIDSEDIDIYRQLSGGVVAAQLLHGSANPVGGQSALIKFRWGSSPNEMRIKDADEYIKFALGENVKQANWGDDYRSRFPQTRMGVEQVYMNAFNEAREYDKEWKAYNALGKRDRARIDAPRRNLQLEALAEIINGERFVTSHSYVQSEINMLMKVAEYFGFRINTFTHILEGYKVADKMAEHGVGGSTFSDWWAYKYEVREAIPYNAALMHQAGVTTAINSDDGEMARRLNQEAAKTIKYGGMSEIEALKMVTINPAKLLHLDDRMGSLKAGKDADIAVWSTHPLSVYAKAKMTLVDGIVYYDEEKDKEIQKAVQSERIRLINKMKGVKNSGGKTSNYTPKEKHRWDCEEFEIDINE